MPSPRRDRISVALCTYNGERFLQRQLASIQEQTRAPDELVICDDGSTDNTFELLREFAASVSFPVRIVRNEKNLGVSKNFEQAIRLCTGELIGLSDQDDIWYPNRLERSEQELATHPEAGLVFSDGDVIDDQDRFLGIKLWQNHAFVGERKRRLLAGDYTVLVKNRFVTGATVMFRSSLRDKCLPLGQGWVHDQWLAAVISAFADLRPIDCSLIRYRKHSSQQIGLSSRLDAWRRKKAHWKILAEQANCLQTLCSVLSELPWGERKCLLLSSYRAQFQFVSFRAALPQGRIRRLRVVLKQYPNYVTGSSGFRSMAKDLILGKPS